METESLVSADVDGKDEDRSLMEDDYGGTGQCEPFLCDEDLQRNTANAQSDSQSKLPEFKNDVPEDISVNGNPEFQKMRVDYEDQVFMPTTIARNFVESSFANGLEPREHKDCAEEWKFDKCLPPIKVRREGQSCDSSPSDLSPPSPKRMKPGSQERRDQWLRLWSTDEKE